MTAFRKYGDNMNAEIREVKGLLVAPNALANVDRGLAEGWITPPARRGPLPSVPCYKAAATVEVLLDDDRGT